MVPDLQHRVMRGSVPNLRAVIGVIAAVVEASGPGAFVVAICCATSSLPPLRKYSVMPVARKVWQLICLDAGVDGYGLRKGATSR